MGSWQRRDPRLLQLAFLSLLLLYGQLFCGFELVPAHGLVVFGVAMAVQGMAIWGLGLPLSSLLSAAITALSLILLLRANTVAWLALGVALSLGSKFVIRARGKHVFNPTNFGIVILLLASGRVWVSPGQWGEGILLFFWVLGLGLVVARRSQRDDISLAFGVSYVALLTARVTYLGQPWPVLWHQLATGSLLIFTFFMISDPRSTPDHRWGRIVLGGAVAAATYVIRFRFYNANALFLALFFLSPLTPLLDTLWKARRFGWAQFKLVPEGVS